MGIIAPNIIRDICVRIERTKQMEPKTYSLFDHISARNEVRKGLHNKCKTLLLSPKSRTMERVEEEIKGQSGL